MYVRRNKKIKITHYDCLSVHYLMNFILFFLKINKDKKQGKRQHQQQQQ